MVTVYVSLIIKEYKTYEQVPASLKAAVKEELGKIGMVLTASR
ncbi:CD1375 family protein [Paenibacillus sp. GCM10012306]